MTITPSTRLRRRSRDEPLPALLFDFSRVVARTTAAGSALAPNLFGQAVAFDRCTDLAELHRWAQLLQNLDAGAHDHGDRSATTTDTDTTTRANPREDGREP
jgi:hypothetical protein